MAPVYLKNILLHIPGSVYWKDKNGVYLGCNQFHATIAGLSCPEEVVGKTDYDLVWKEIAPTLIKTDQEIMQSGIPKEIIEIPTLLNGKKISMITNKAPLFDDKGEIIGIIGTSIDITEQRRIEHELCQTSQKLENVLDTIPGHIYWKDKNGAYLGCNNLQAQSFGLSKKEEVLGKTDHELQWKETADILRKIDKDVMKSRLSVTVEEPGVCSDNTVFLSRKVPLYDLNDKDKVIGILGVSFDITDQKLTEKKLLETHHKLEGMTVVSASIAHELRTPLASLQFSISNLRRDISELLKRHSAEPGQSSEKTSISNIADSIKDTFEAMDREINLSNLVIDLLLENVKPQAKTKEESTFSIIECINKALKRYPFTKSQKKLIHWQPQFDFMVEGNELTIAHILFNLFKNSLYFIAKARTGNIFITLEKDKSYNYLIFKDTGAGISKEHLPYIFDRFFSKTNHGAGIGLAWCKMAVESLGGNIQCDSVESEYTSFKITLPNV